MKQFSLSEFDRNIIDFDNSISNIRNLDENLDEDEVEELISIYKEYEYLNLNLIDIKSIMELLYDNEEAQELLGVKIT
jgi:hypothetical protein